MEGLFLSPLGNKAQVTLPKAVRRALGLKAPRDLVGFHVRGRRVALTSVEPVPSSDPFSESDWGRINKLAGRPPAAAFPRSADSLAHLKGLLGFK